MRVLHLPITALYQPSLMVNTLRSQGIKADTMLYTRTFGHHAFDVGHQIVTGNSVISSVNFHFIAHALDHYDVFHFHSGYGYFYDSCRGKQLSLLKKLGKAVVISRWGCRDGRTPSSFHKERGLCEICPTQYTFCSDDICSQRLENERKYADLIINHEPDFMEYNEKTFYMPGMVDLDFWRPALPIPAKHKLEKDRNALHILHAVGGNKRGDVKGTSLIEETIQELKDRGIKVVAQTVQGISFKELRYHILQADIIIDQLRYGSFGSFARESMALGKPVVGTIAPSLRKHLPDIPLQTIEDRPLISILEELASSPQRREVIGKKCRAYAEQTFCSNKLTSKLISLYNDILKGKHYVD